MHINNAELSDAEAIAKNNVLLAKESENVEISYEKTLDGVKSVISDPSKGFYLVAKEDNYIIGQLMITFEWSDWHNKNMWWIQSVYVNKNYRKMGIFKKLLNRAKELAKENNVNVLKLYVHDKNHNAIKAYNKLKMKEKPYIIYQLEL